MYAYYSIPYTVSYSRRALARALDGIVLLSVASRLPRCRRCQRQRKRLPPFPVPQTCLWPPSPSLSFWSLSLSLSHFSLIGRGDFASCTQNFPTNQAQGLHVMYSWSIGETGLPCGTCLPCLPCPCSSAHHPGRPLLRQVALAAARYFRVPYLVGSRPPLLSYHTTQGILCKIFYNVQNIRRIFRARVQVRLPLRSEDGACTRASYDSALRHMPTRSTDAPRDFMARQPSRTRRNRQQGTGGRAACAAFHGDQYARPVLRMALFGRVCFSFCFCVRLAPRSRESHLCIVLLLPICRTGRA